MSQKKQKTTTTRKHILEYTKRISGRHLDKQTTDVATTQQ